MEKTRMSADLRIMGKKIDVQDLTETLKITPSEVWNEGDCIRNTQNRRSYTAWIYNTGTMESLDVEDVTRHIEKVFLPKMTQLMQLKQKYDFEVSIDIVVVIENMEPPAMCFTSKFIKFATELDARIDVDTYVN